MMTHDLRIAPRHSTALKHTKTVLHGMFLFRGKYFICLNFPTKDLTEARGEGLVCLGERRGSVMFRQEENKRIKHTTPSPLA